MNGLRPEVRSPDASCLWTGSVVHRRRTPVSHGFRYDVALLSFDLADARELDRLAPLFGADRRAPVCWRRSDHFGDPRVSLDSEVRDLVAARTGSRPGGPIRILTSPRVLGYGFNPISFYFCRSVAGPVEAIVAEVTSTPWGERHCYVLAIPRERRGRGLQRFVTPKRLHVSPFLGMQQDYRWRISMDDERISVAIAASVRSGDSGRQAPFAAALTLTRAPLTRASLVQFLFRPLLGAMGTMAAIHFEALRLWAKGAPYRPHPGRAAPSPALARGNHDGASHDGRAFSE